MLLDKLDIKVVYIGDHALNDIHATFEFKTLLGKEGSEA